MSENNHKLGIKIPKDFCCHKGVDIYIDRERINAIELCPIDREGRRMGNFGEMDLEFEVLELKVRDIEDIALLMDEETFNKFCELWRLYHEK